MGRRESEKAWATLLEKQDRSTRMRQPPDLGHYEKNPLKAPIVAVDKAIERDKLDQAILKVQGLTDLWRTLYDAPTIEQNVALVKKVFAIELQPDLWKQFSSLAGELNL